MGRIVLPKDIRKRFGIGEGTPMEIFVTSEEIILKKYNLDKELLNMAENLMETVEEKSADLGTEKVTKIRQHMYEIQQLLNNKD